MARKFEQKGTKKELIAKMFLDTNNKLSAREIARIVGSTEGNVLKEISKLRSTGILADREVSIFSHSEGDDTLTLARAEANMLVTHTDSRSMTDIPPLRQDDLKRLYSEFMRGKTPVEVIAENGFNPALVEFEFKRFSRLNGLNLHTLPKNIIDTFDLDEDQTLRPILEKIEQNGLKSNADLIKMTEVVSSLSIRKNEVSFIERMKNGNSIGQFRPFECPLCQEPMAGLLYDDGSEIGIKVEQAIGRPVHERCNKESYWTSPA